MAGGAVVFLLTDGTSLLVPDGDVRALFDALWGLADLPGAVSTAALLIEQARKLDVYRHPVMLNLTQERALKQAVLFANVT